MKLFFMCPIKKEKFGSDDYSLHKGHRIVENEAGTKELQGNVILNSRCPLCGQNHRFKVQDVLCPLKEEKGEK